MTKKQKESIFAFIEKIKEYNIDELIASTFPDTEDIKKEKIGQYSTVEFKNFLQRALRQLEAELNSDEFHFIPIAVNGVLGMNFNLTTTLQNIHNQVINRQLVNIPANLNNLILFEKAYGFWSKSVTKVHDVKTLELAKGKKGIELLEQQVNQQVDLINQQKEGIEKTKKEFIGFINTKKGELTEVENLLAQVKGNASTINNLVQDSQANKGKIEEVLNTQNKLLDDVRKRVEDERSKYGDFEKENIDLEKKLKASLTSSEEKFIGFKKHYEFIAEKKDDIEKLTGMAADGALGNRFFTRQDTLKTSLKIWGAAVAISVLTTAGWIFAVFNMFTSVSEIEWVNLIINVIKTLPAFVLLGFCIKQYVKERNLQEEYAYRAAVAMTITAYSEMLKDSDIENNVSRQQMLLDAIQRVYTSPKIHRDREDKIFSMSTKDLRESIKELTTVVKDLKKDVLS